MMKKMQTADRLTAAVLKEWGRSFSSHELLGAWLYGSRARGESRPDSDIDLAVLSDRPLDPVELFDAAGRLAGSLGATVDLVDLRQAGGLLKVEATHHGQPLVPISREAALFAAHALADHAAFAPRRRAATQAFVEAFRAG